MDSRTRKPMTKEKAMHPWNDKDRLYISRNERRGYFSIKDYVDTLIKWLEFDI